MPNKKQAELQETPEYHNTYLLLKKYRDVVWNLELSVQRVKNKFRIEMECDTVGGTAVGCFSCIPSISSDFSKCDGSGNRSSKNTYCFLPVLCIMGIPAFGLCTICYWNSEKNTNISR